MNSLIMRYLNLQVQHHYPFPLTTSLLLDGWHFWYRVKTPVYVPLSNCDGHVENSPAFLVFLHLHWNSLNLYSCGVAHRWEHVKICVLFEASDHFWRANCVLLSAGLLEPHYWVGFFRRNAPWLFCAMDPCTGTFANRYRKQSDSLSLCLLAQYMYSA